MVSCAGVGVLEMSNRVSTIFGAAALVLAAWPVVGHAGSSVCWSERFAGLHAVSDRAEAALGSPTHDSARVVIYFEKVNGIFFYQTNYLPAGEQSPAKIVSTEAMGVEEVLSNILVRREPGSRLDRATLEVASAGATMYAGEPEQYAQAEPSDSGRPW